MAEFGGDAAQRSLFGSTEEVLIRPVKKSPVWS